MLHRPAIAVAAVLLAAVSLSLPLAAERAAAEGEEEIRVFRLNHIGTKTAVTLFRTLLQTRVVAEVPAQQTVILRDTPEVLAQAERLMADIDAAQPRWTAQLVVDSGQREQVIREIDLADLEAGIWFGQSDAWNVGVELDCGPAGNGLIDVGYEINLRLSGSQDTPHVFKERGSTRLAAGDSFIVFRADSEELKSSLARVLGLEGQVDALRLGFRQRS